MKKLLKFAAFASAGTLLLGGVTFAGSRGYDNYHDETKNDTSMEQVNKINADVMNHLMLDNNVDGTVTTGNNQANFNGDEGDGSVTTGNATAMVDVTNQGNNSVADLSFASMPTNGDMSVGTSDADSVTTRVKTENTLDVNVTNCATVNNDIMLKADTGNNKANDNATNGTVNTGDASASVKISNNLNSSDLTVR